MGTGCTVGTSTVACTDDTPCVDYGAVCDSELCRCPPTGGITAAPHD